MTSFLRSGTVYKPIAETNLNLHQQLPAVNFTIKANAMSGELYFDQVDDFVQPPKFYGKLLPHATRIMRTFWDRPSSTGVLLAGEKGSGKTLLARQLAVMGQEQGMPTILVNQPLHGDKFNLLIQSVVQPSIVFFDEVDKVYDDDEQLQLLTLLDGVFPSKKLFVLTCNDRWKISAQMHNRPGRIFYALNYTGVEEDFILEYCEDTLNDKAQISSILSIAQSFQHFNFDMLKALVEEMNRYGESAQEVVKMLNVNPSEADRAHFTVTYFVGDQEIIYEGHDYVTISTVCNPLADAGDGDLDLNIPILANHINKSRDDSLEIFLPCDDGCSPEPPVNKPIRERTKSGEYGTKRIALREHHFKGIDRKTGNFMFEYTYRDITYTIVFSRTRTRPVNYYQGF